MMPNVEPIRRDDTGPILPPPNNVEERLTAVESAVARIETAVRNLGKKTTFAAMVGASIGEGLFRLYTELSQ